VRSNNTMGLGVLVILEKPYKAPGRGALSFGLFFCWRSKLPLWSVYPADAHSTFTTFNFSAMVVLIWDVAHIPRSRSRLISGLDL